MPAYDGAMHAPAPPVANPVPWRQDARTIGLIGLAHGTSHFFHMLLAPMFPWLMPAFGLSYAELGLLVSVFFVISGLGQAAGGFVVDRFGARPVLFGALGCFVAAALVAATASGYASLMLASALAGLGNAPFHPADFTILNKRVSAARLGHAFSAHGITGNLGWAAAPLLLGGLTLATGSWRLAYLGAALWAAAVLALLLWQRAAVDDRLGHWAHEKPGVPAIQGTATLTPAQAEGAHPLAFLKLPSLWLCFSFFFFTTVPLAAMQSFAGPALQQLHALPPAWTSLVITGYMLCGAAGLVLGGFLVARPQRLERLIAGCLLASAAALALAGLPGLPGGVAVALAVLSGLGSGLAGPSRDMLVKRAAPPNATGRVYGIVYSGFDLGLALAAPMLGRLMDGGQLAGVFYAAAAALVAAVAAAALVGQRIAHAQVPGPGARKPAKMAA